MKPHWLEIIFGCFHKWSVIDTTPIKQFGVQQGQIKTLQCEKCGDLKYKKFSVWDL